jgi:hypothetical protein
MGQPRSFDGLEDLVELNFEKPERENQILQVDIRQSSDPYHSYFY